MLDEFLVAFPKFREKVLILANNRVPFISGNLFDEYVTSFPILQDKIRVMSASGISIAQGGIKGLVVFSKNAAQVLGQVLVIVSYIALMADTVRRAAEELFTMIKACADAVSQIIETNITRDERIAALEVALGSLNNQQARTQQQVNAFERGLTNVEFTANEALTEVANLEELIKSNHSQTMGKFTSAQTFQSANFDFLKEKTNFTFNQINTGALQRSTATLSKAAIEAPGTKLSDVHAATVGMPIAAQSDTAYKTAIAASTTIAAGTLGYSTWKNAESVKGAVSGLGATINGGFNQLKNQGRKIASMINVGKIMDAVTLIVTLHNAAMLSRNIGVTLMQVTDNGINAVLNAFGIKGIDDEGVNTAKSVKDLLDSWGKQIFGVTAWTQIKAKWAAYNTIVSSANTLFWSVRDFANTTNEIASIAAENSGKVGNSLRKSGVLEDRGPLLPEKVNRETAIQKKLQDIQNLSSVFLDITENILESQEALKEIQDNNKKFKEDLDKGVKTLTEEVNLDKFKSQGKAVSEDDAKPTDGDND
ncbi:hypothetical protein ACE1CB_22355 [Aerosakkonema sp. BLCC-F2]